MIYCYEKLRSHATIDYRYAYWEGDMVIMRGKMLCKIGMLAVGPCRFIRYTNNSGLLEEVEDKTGTMQKVLSSHLLPCLSVPEQV